jgi:hypothetical protein
MKLSPPASSSDIEAAREIARRLHQRRRREDRPETDEGPPAPRAAVPVAPATPPPSPIEPPGPAPIDPTEPPTWDEPVEELAPASDADFDALRAFGEPTTDNEPLTDAEVPELPVEEPGVSPEEMVGVEMPPAPPLDEEASPSPFEVNLDEASADEVIDVPAPPSWDDVAVACLDLSQAGGAMLVDPDGHVFALRGEWPEPGPDAIAAKLVTTMNRTLRDAPTRSISAPLMGKHLTAWRVPLGDGLVTAAFIGGSPVRSEARPVIDAEIRRGPGA